MRRPKVYKVRITAYAMPKRKCAGGFKVGDSWDVVPGNLPVGLCAGAYNSMALMLRVMQFGGVQPWDKDKDVTYVSCPDPGRQVIYELRRLEKIDFPHDLGDYLYDPKEHAPSK